VTSNNVTEFNVCIIIIRQFAYKIISRDESGREMVVNRLYYERKNALVIL
jgi:hypothetical protein